MSLVFYFKSPHQTQGQQNFLLFLPEGLQFTIFHLGLLSILSYLLGKV